MRAEVCKVNRRWHVYATERPVTPYDARLCLKDRGMPFFPERHFSTHAEAITYAHRITHPTPATTGHDTKEKNA